MRDIEKAGMRGDVVREVHALRRDIEQLDRLLGDAVARLTDSFESIACSTLQGDVAHRTQHPGDEAVDATATASVATNLGKALTALQFHDIASQLLGRVHTRLDVVDRLVHVGRQHGRPVGKAVEPQRGRAGGSQISQTTMAVGMVELF